MNKLRGLSLGGPALLLVASAWALLRYPGWVPFAVAATLGLVVAGLPRGIASGKLWLRRLWRRLSDARSDEPLRDATFVSDAPVEDPAAELSAIAEAVRGADGFDGVRREAFDDGEGLVVTHAGFHSSFVRLTGRGHLAVTGASKRTRRLVDLIEAARPHSLSDRTNNPLRRPDRVRGAPRVFLAVLLVALLLVGAGAIANGAYPADAYTSGEKAVFVVIDARADVHPGVSGTDAALSKAEFVVSSLEEEAVEVAWESNSTDLLAEHGHQSLRMSEDARALLADARGDSLSAAQAERADRIEADLHEAEAAIAAALTRRIERSPLEGETTELRAARDALRAAADRPARVRTRDRPSIRVGVPVAGPPDGKGYHPAPSRHGHPWR